MFSMLAIEQTNEKLNRYVSQTRSSWKQFKSGITLRQSEIEKFWKHFKIESCASAHLITQIALKYCEVFVKRNVFPTLRISITLRKLEIAREGRIVTLQVIRKKNNVTLCFTATAGNCCLCFPLDLFASISNWFQCMVGRQARHDRLVTGSLSVFCSKAQFQMHGSVSLLSIVFLSHLLYLLRTVTQDTTISCRAKL